MKNIWSQIRNNLWAAPLFAGVGLLVYSSQTWQYIHTRDSILDEGAYLYKGWLFVTGQYELYQDYGVWSNHMPLSFYLPGLVQRLFGPGLRTGRYLAVGLGILTLIGLWLVVTRLKGEWWGAAAVWMIAINTVQIKMYSVMVTQVLIAALLVWTLVFALGEKRTWWQICLAAILAGASLLTRINLAPLLPLLVLYVWWQHGWKAGLVASVAGGMTVLIGHALFWPGILRMWAYWMPPEITPFLAPWRPPPGVDPSWDPSIDLIGRATSFFLSWRVSFTALAGVLATLLLWPRRQLEVNWPRLRMLIFLVVLFASLLLIHMWATLAKNYCVYCLPGYTTFFSPAGLIIVILGLAMWERQLPLSRQALIVISILLLAAGIGFSTFEDFGSVLYRLPVPTVSQGRLLFLADTQLGEFIRDRYGLHPRDIRRLLPTLAGLLAGAAILLLSLLVYLRSRRSTSPGRASYGYLAMLVFWLGGTLLAPTRFLGGGYTFYECPGDVIQSYEVAGQQLAEIIPPGATVYWKGGLSAVPLLYLPEIKIFPPLINGRYSYYENGDSDALRRYGFWNEELGQQWTHEADYLLVEKTFLNGWLKEIVLNGPYEELPPTPPVVPCRPDGNILIFKQIR